MKLLKWSILTIIALGMYSCYSDPDFSELSSDFVVATDKDLQANFSEYLTYYISDTIPKITDDVNDSLFIGTEALEIVNKIKENLNNRGYQFVQIDENPDLAIVPTILQVENQGTVCSGWWGGYGGYWGGGYWGYPGYGYYYPYCGYYSYNTGSFAMDMLDLKNVDDNNNISALWTTALFGSLNSSEEVNLNRTLEGIEQAFIQSPYIKN